MSWFDDNAYQASTPAASTDPNFGSMMSPWTGSLNPSAPPAAQMYTPTGFQGPAAWQKPADFASPTVSAMNIDPSYGFRLQQGQNQLMNNGAASGLLRTGATAKGLMDYGQNAASQEYQNIYGRSLNNYTTNANLGQAAQQQAYNQALGGWQANTQAGMNATQMNNSAQNAAWGNQFTADQAKYNAGFGAFQYNQQTPYNMLMGVLNSGQNAANSQASLGSNYANAYGNVLNGNTTDINNSNMSGANASAAGTMGIANSVANGVGQLGNYYTQQSMMNNLWPGTSASSAYNNGLSTGVTNGLPAGSTTNWGSLPSLTGNSANYNGVTYGNAQSPATSWYSSGATNPYSKITW